MNPGASAAPARPRLSPPLITLFDLLLLAGLCLLFFWRDLPLAGVDYRGFAEGDFSNQFYAFASYRAARLSAGEIPMWSPYALSGHPFLADIQSAVFYPPARLAVALAGSGFNYATLQLEALAHYPLAAAGMYFLARRLTGSRVGAWVAAVAFTFSAYLTGYPLLQLAILETVVWLPWLFLALDYAAARVAAGRIRAALAPVAAAGVLFGIALLAGHPQSALLVAYAALAFALFRAAQAARGRPWRAALGRLAAMLAFLPLGAALAAAQLLPSLEYMRLSTRAGLGMDAAGGGFTPYDLIQLIFPQVGAPFAALYVGALALGLALFALLSAVRRGPAAAPVPRDLAGFFGGLSLLGIFLSFGQITPVYHLAYLVLPGWRLFRGQERLAVWVVFGLAILAGLGAAALARDRAARSASAPTAATAGRSPSSPLARGFWIAAALALLFAAACFVGYQAGSQGLWGFTAAGIFLALMLAASGVAAATGHPALLVAVMVVDLFTLSAAQHAGSTASAQPFPSGPAFAAVQADDSTFRTANEGVLPDHIGYGYGFEEIGGASPLRLAAYDRLLREAPKPLLWRLLGVKYVFTWRQELEAPAERVAEQAGSEGKPVYLHRLAQPAPLAWFNGVATVEPDLGAQVARILSGSFDPDSEAILSAPPEPAPAEGCSGDLEWRRRAPEQLVFRVTASAPCVLTLSEIAYPGWEAEVGGRPAPLLIANAVLRAVAVPAGASDVVLTFRSRTASAGALVTMLALLVALVALAVALAGPRQRRRPPPA